MLESNFAVRRWVCPSNGAMTVNWLLRDRDPSCGNGVTGHVFIDGVLRWSGTIDNGDIVGLESGLSLCASIGMTIDFAIDPGNGNQLCDSTDFSQIIYVRSCPADLNCDGIANSADFFDFLTAFFNAEPAADFNGDEQVTSQDFFDFLAAFFAGC